MSIKINRYMVISVLVALLFGTFWTIAKNLGPAYKAEPMLMLVDLGVMSIQVFALMLWVKGKE